MILNLSDMAFIYMDSFYALFRLLVCNLSILEFMVIPILLHTLWMDRIYHLHVINDGFVTREFSLEITRYI
ncbi:hypothetical protein VCO01S_00410 [Vibrio comitans NBRC 102076]|uniref:Uncharacterized protein n=1 Tax=Vibrio comitans NBRC 102076 TaxID=1219078 RepID=A0A4Y3IIR2_9VIBR|nr:hypothetical protein VCO01S_00410 [Vibrio comitans NBRC 102076]